nr:hypothetical protein [Tanacetum cinerariifolium]
MKKKKRINVGGSSTFSVNPSRNSAFVETIDAGRPRRIQVREVMPVPRNGMNLMTENSVVGEAAEMMRTASPTWCGIGLGFGVGGEGGASVVGSMLGLLGRCFGWWSWLRAGDGSCVTAITGNEEGCVSSLDLTLKL